MMSQDTLRILIADDVPQVRQGLATMLNLAARNIQLQIEIIGEAQNGREAIQLASMLNPDVILMDLEMPVVDGYAATQCIKSARPRVGIIVLTIHHDEPSRLKAAQAGADAFIDKSAPLDDLLQAIRGFRKTPG
ncbi:MAG: response regulator transcription factor [Acidobacteriaceae bacterium]